MHQPMWFKRTVLGSPTPVIAPLHIKPTAAPSGTAAAGDLYFNSTSAVLLSHDGTAYAPVSGKRVVKTAAATLTAADSGALCLFNAAAGFTYTLPSAQEGLWFDFQVTVTVTSVVDRIACASGDFLLGHMVQSTDGTFVNAYHAANGSTHLAWEGNGSTTGGLVGDVVRVVGISTTQWAVWGIGQATGTEATPFKTS